MIYRTGFVHKYGGTSVITPQQDLAILERTINEHQTVPANGYSVVVTSGMGKTDKPKLTDIMYQIVSGVHQEDNWKQVKHSVLSKAHWHGLNPNLFDNECNRIESVLLSGNLDSEAEPHFIGFPELVQSKLLYELGKMKYPHSNWNLVCHPYGLVGHNQHGTINVPINQQASLHCINNISKQYKGGITIVPGFIGSGPVTLERGSSDATATYWGAALSLDEVIIYSDRPGILPIHPDIIDGLSPLRELTHAEAHFYSGWGAGIIQQVALAPVRNTDTRLKIKSSIQPDLPGTIIGGRPYTDNYGVKAVAYVPGLTSVLVRGISDRPGSGAAVESLFGKNGVSIDFLADGTDKRAHIVNSNHPRFGQLLHDLYKDHCVETSGELVRVALVGDGMDLATRLNGGLHATEIMTDTLRDERIRTVYRTAFKGDTTHSVFVNKQDGHKLVKALAKNLGIVKDVCKL